MEEYKVPTTSVAPLLGASAANLYTAITTATTNTTQQEVLAKAVSEASDGTLEPNRFTKYATKDAAKNQLNTLTKDAANEAILKTTFETP
jgi:hypothetical protein